MIEYAEYTQEKDPITSTVMESCQCMLDFYRVARSKPVLDIGHHYHSLECDHAARLYNRMIDQLEIMKQKKQLGSLVFHMHRFIAVFDAEHPTFGLFDCLDISKKKRLAWDQLGRYLAPSVDLNNFDQYQDADLATIQGFANRHTRRMEPIEVDDLVMLRLQLMG